MMYEALGDLESMCGMADKTVFTRTKFMLLHFLKQCKELQRLHEIVVKRNRFKSVGRYVRQDLPT